MKRRLLNRIIRPHISIWRVLVANAGTALGLAGFLLAVQLHFDFEALFGGDGEAGPASDYLMISKAVTLGNTLTFKSPAFSKKEIAGIRDQPFVTDLGEITGNTFKITAAPAGPLRFYTDLFVESLPTKLLDELPDNWTWEEGDDAIPAIMSQEFLNLYNFVYAPSQGFPPLTREALMLVPLQVTIGNEKERVRMNVRIKGFSSRVTSVIVPEQFLKWANEKYGTNANPAPCRLLVQVADAADPAIATFIGENRYETNRDRLRRSRTAAAARIAVIVTGAISLLIAGLSVLLAAMNAQLLISRSAAALSLLVDIGYERGSLTGWLLVRHTGFLAVVLALAWTLFRCGLTQVRGLFTESGFAPPAGTAPEAILALVLFAGTTLALQFAAVRSGLIGVERRGELR